MPLTIRRGAAVLVAVVLLLLTGCSASGTIEVRSADELAVDLTFGGADRCDGTFYLDVSLTFQTRTDANGNPVCQVSGTVHPESLRPYLGVSHAGEFLVFSFNPLAVAPGSEATGGDLFSALSQLDIAVRFPGQVVSTNGVADGNAARFRDTQQLVRPYGLAAEGLDHPGPSWAVIGPLVGFVTGVAVMALWLVVAKHRRRRRSQQPAGIDDQPVGIDRETDEQELADPGDLAPVEVTAVDGRPDESAFWRAEPSEPEPAAGRTPDEPEPAGRTPDEPAPRPRPDDSVWAPPE
ncbi:MAG: hypothetical protein QM582_09850 [Micropruina sp.]|uniref:hypothetical protein n=1 Tax=Micropruina sp. TaxID=2737536 RepID=UPI0039E340B3